MWQKKVDAGAAKVTGDVYVAGGRREDSKRPAATCMWQKKVRACRTLAPAVACESGSKGRP
jgi:hypothetical protein